MSQDAPSSRPYIGTAGWTIPKHYVDRFAIGGSHLERYAGVLNAVEINSSFYRPHRRTTYERWAASVPDDFRFAVKVPKAITHEHRLIDCADLLARFAGEVGGLDGKLGVLLVQLPPSLAYDAPVVETFFTQFRALTDADLVCEPRHASWFAPAAEASLTRLRVARAAADPAVAPDANQPGGWPGLVYYRMHGSPRIYYSDYPAEVLDRLAGHLAAAGPMTPTWCIFDNTAAFAALGNALDLAGRL